MLFHTWPFFIFLAIVLPGFFALRKSRLWLPWLTLASYFFYGWWNPYYLLLVMYSTVLDFSLVALMDHCPHSGEKVDVWATPKGNFPIWRKMVSLHMSGGTTGGGWDLPGIGWVSLFVGSGVAVGTAVGRSEIDCTNTAENLGCLSRLAAKAVT